MPPKRGTTSLASGKAPKRLKKVMTLHDKVELLDMLRKGKSFAAVGRHYKVNESTVRSIKKNEKAIRASVASSYRGSAKKMNVVRNKGMVRMESALVFWIQDLQRKNIPFNTKMICKKALSLYSQFSEGNEGEQPGSSTASAAEPFQASKGWFDGFVKRYQIRNGKSHGEGAAADTNAAKDPDALKQLKNGHKPEQPLTDEDLAEMTKPASDDETEDQEATSQENQEATSQENQEDESLTLERLTELMQTAKLLQQKAKSWDRHMVRSLQFSNTIDCVMSTYKTLFTTMNNQQSQLPKTMFRTKAKKSLQNLH